MTGSIFRSKINFLWIFFESHKNVASNWRIKLINDHDFNPHFGPQPFAPGAPRLPSPNYTTAMLNMSIELEIARAQLDR